MEFRVSSCPRWKLLRNAAPFGSFVGRAVAQTASAFSSRSFGSLSLLCRIAQSNLSENETERSDVETFIPDVKADATGLELSEEVFRRYSSWTRKRYRAVAVTSSGHLGLKFVTYI